MWSRFVLLLLIACFIHELSAALFAVDLGSEFIKVSLIKPGRVPISIVHNELSKRKTPSAVAFHHTTRVYGEDAYTLLTKTPDRVFLRTRDFLGRNASDPLLGHLFGENEEWKAPYKFKSDSKIIHFQTGDQESLSVLEILGSLLSYVKAITKTEAGEEVVDCVIALPAFFGPVQKRAVLDAAKLADINVLAMINAHGAAALQYGIERDFNNVSQNVVIYDMGSNTIQASLVSYTAYEGTHLGRNNKIGQFEVKDVVWNENLGGDHLDWTLVHYFAKRFNAKFKVDVYTSSRAIMKLKKAAGKTKHILSANSDASFHVEELYDGHDFNDKISRTEFEELNQEFFKEALLPLKSLLDRNEIEVSNLTAVELIGGGSRVPKIQSILSEALGGRQLDKHLDGDEAVVMGAGLVAANLSTIFRLRKFGYIDGAIYPMSLQVLEPKGWKPLPDVDVTSLFRPKSLLPYMKRLPCKRVVHLFNISNAETFQFEIKYDTSTGRPLPPGAVTDVYATYTVTGIKEAVKKLGEGGKITIHFVVDLSGLIEVDRADYVVEVIETIPPAKNAPDKNITNTTNTTDAADASKNETDTTETPKNETESVQTKKVFKRSVVTVSSGVFTQPSLTAEEFKASKAVLMKFSRGEAEKKASEKAKNELESYVVAAKEKLRDQFEVKEVTTETQRTEFMDQLITIEDWLYMDGADAGASAFNEKLKELQTVGTPIFIRVAESVNRPLAVKEARTLLGVIEKALNSWPDTRPWLRDELNELADEVIDFRQWLEESDEAQGELEPHEMPIFTSTQVQRRVKKVERIMDKLNKKKPPKTAETNKTAGSNETNTTTDSTNTTTNATTEDTAKTEDISVKIETEASEDELQSDHTELHFAERSEGIRSFLEAALATAIGSGYALTTPDTFAAQGSKSDLEEIARWRTNTDTAKKLASQGRLDDAGMKFSIALEAAIRGFGLDAPHVAMSCNNLAEVLRVQGKLDEAIELYNQAVEVFLIHYTLEDPRTATTYYNLATALYLSGQFEEARKAAERGFDGMKGMFGSERTETLAVEILLAKSEWKLNHHRKALFHVNACHDVLIKKDLRTMENAQVAAEVISLLLAMNNQKMIKSMVEFIANCFEEAKKEKSFQIRQLTEKLADSFVDKQMFSEAKKICVEAESSMKRLELTESLSIAAIKRKQALVYLKDPQGPSGTGINLVVSSFEMVWKMMQNIPAGYQWITKLPNFLRGWFQSKDANEEAEARKHVILNCVYDLVQDAHLMSEFLKSTDNSVNEESQMKSCLERCLRALSQEDVQNALEEFSQQSQHSKRCEEIRRCKVQIEELLNAFVLAVIDEKYVLPYATYHTSVILKTVCQQKQNQPLTSETLWDLIQDSEVYSSKNQMKMGIAELRALGYLDYVQDRGGRYVVTLTSKSKLIKATIEERKKIIDKWKRLSYSLTDYILPGMTPDTALVISLLANTPDRRLPLADMWHQLQASGNYNDSSHVKVVLSQLKLMDYIYVFTINMDFEEPTRYIGLSRRVQTINGKIVHCIVKRRKPFV
eukprot:g1835.t1